MRGSFAILRGKRLPPLLSLKRSSTSQRENRWGFVGTMRFILRSREHWLRVCPARLIGQPKAEREMALLQQPNFIFIFVNNLSQGRRAFAHGKRLLYGPLQSTIRENSFFWFRGASRICLQLRRWTLGRTLGEA